jgi:hypothetical protein
MFQINFDKLKQLNLVFRNGPFERSFYNGRKDSSTLIRNTSIHLGERKAIKNSTVIVYDDLRTLYGIRKGCLRNKIWEEEFKNRETIFVCDTEFDSTINLLLEIVLFEISYKNPEPVVKIYYYNRNSHCSTCLEEIKEIISVNTIYMNDPSQDKRYITAREFKDVKEIIFCHPDKTSLFKCFEDVLQISNIIDSFRVRTFTDQDVRKFHYENCTECSECTKIVDNFLLNDVKRFESYIPELDKPQDISLQEFIEKSYLKKRRKDTSHDYIIGLSLEEAFELQKKDALLHSLSPLKKNVSYRYKIIEKCYFVNNEFKQEFTLQKISSENKLHLFLDSEDNDLNDANLWLEFLLKTEAEAQQKKHYDIPLAAEKGMINRNIVVQKMPVEIKEETINPIHKVNDNTCTELMVVNKLFELQQLGIVQFSCREVGITVNGFKHVVFMNKGEFEGFGSSKKSAKRDAYSKALESLGFKIVKSTFNF